MTYKEDMKFQKHLSLWDWQSSGVSARNKFRRSMAPNFPWKYPCAKGNLPELDLKILLDTKKGLDAVVKFLDSLPQLLCWWFAWLSSLFSMNNPTPFLVPPLNYSLKYLNWNYHFYDSKFSSFRFFWAVFWGSNHYVVKWS